jgi:hypothetical protein
MALQESTSQSGMAAGEAHRSALAANPVYVLYLAHMTQAGS